MKNESFFGRDHRKVEPQCCSKSFFVLFWRNDRWDFVRMWKETRSFDPCFQLFVQSIGTHIIYKENEIVYGSTNS